MPDSLSHPQQPDDPHGYLRFHELARRLRAECPWDIEQTHESLVPYLIEESYEVVDAIGDRSQHGDDPLIEELGDLLYQIEFHAAIAEQEGRFTIADVTEGIHDKLVRRHPHVFGSSDTSSTADLSADWEALKRAEKPERTSALDGVAQSLPALSLAREIQRKAARVGGDWDSAARSAAKVREELDEVLAEFPHQEQATTAGNDVDSSGATQARLNEEVGDLLFAVVNLARHVGVDPESSLRAATAKFGQRFRSIEAAAAHDGVDVRDLPSDELQVYWQAAKHTGSS